MTNKGYIVIQDWMIDLPLSLAETTIYAIIYGFSQDGESNFSGSLAYIARKSKVSKATARRALQVLVDGGYIQKDEVKRNGVVFNVYQVNDLQEGVSICEGGGINLQPNNKDIYKDINICSNKKAAFVKPTLYDVQTYCLERGNTIDPQAFIDFYESNGWMVGKNRMKDWKAAVRTWESRNATRPKAQQPVKKQSNLERLNAMAAEIMGDFKL